MRVWINFKELRAKLNFEDVLRHYGVEIKRKGSQHQGFCPMPGHSGKKNSPSFSANLEKGIFKCFSCGAEGNQLDFAALMKGVDPRDGDALRSIAVELQQHFFPAGASTRTKPVATKADTESKSLPVKINEPLDFELKDLDAGHEYITHRKITRETAQYFGLGFCSRGMLKDRLAIPLHNAEGNLLGYAGRVVDDVTITEENPKYRLPSRRERGGIIYEFKKSLFLYNGFRLKPDDGDLIVVEGFPSVWWLTQNGFPRVVATMGSDFSDEQIDRIRWLTATDSRVWVMPDGDEAGERFGRAIISRLSLDRFVRWARLPEGKQPTDLSDRDLAVFLSIL